MSTNLGIVESRRNPEKNMPRTESRSAMTWIIVDKHRISSSRRNEIFFIILITIILSFSKILEASPATRRLEGKSTTRSRETTLLSSVKSEAKSERSDEKVGNPSDLAWRAWLLIDKNSNPDTSGILDSANLLRRITPKSIFIAPALTACAEGYQADTMNRCVKDVSIDGQAHRGFLIERLNAIFANVAAAKPQFPQETSAAGTFTNLPSGPLQLSIPLSMPEATKIIDPSETDETRREIVDDDASRRENVKNDKTEAGNMKNLPKESQIGDHRVEQAIATIYELDKTAIDAEDKIILGDANNENKTENFKLKPSIEKITLPRHEIIDEINDENSSSIIVNYEIPFDDKRLRTRNSSENSNVYANNDDTIDSSSLSPTLVLLLSSSKKLRAPTGSSEDLVVARNSSLDQVITRMENFTIDMSDKEMISLNLPDESFRNETTMRENETRSIFDQDEEFTTTRDDIYDRRTTIMTTTMINDESTEIYDDNYEESTELDDNDDDDDDDDDEILRHSEAGRPLKLTKIKINGSIEMPKMKFHSIVVSRDKESTHDSDISSEVSINPDFIRETTLVDFNPRKNMNSSSATSSAMNNQESTTANPSTVTREPEFSKITLESSDNSKNEKSPDESSESTVIYDNASKKNEKIHEKDVKIFDSSSNESFSLDASSRKNFNRTATTKENHRAVSTSEEIYPVRGIEEAAFENSAGRDFSSTERSDSEETMIAASTNLAATIITSEKFKFPTNDDEFNDRTRITKIPAISSTTGSPRREEIYDYEISSSEKSSNRENSPIIRENQDSTMIRDANEEIYRTSLNRDPSFVEKKFFPPSQRNEERQRQAYVRFPNYETKSDNPVRFPTDDANSISNEYKERNRRPHGSRTEQRYSDQRESTMRDNSATNLSENEAYRWLPNDWRNDRRKQSDIFAQRSRSGIVDRQRSRDSPPHLLKFWTRMPLVRDPSYAYPARSRPINDHPIRRLGATGGAGGAAKDERIDEKFVFQTTSGSSARRLNYYRDIANPDISRAFSRSNRAVLGR